jgi:hypothetical protein
VTVPPATGATLGPVASGSISCGTAREFLTRLAAGEPVTASPDVWAELSRWKVLGGTEVHPELTDTGRKVLHELTVRAQRVDPRPLEEVSVEIGNGVATLARRGVNAAYFLAELGPVPPVEVVPYLRIVAAGLACRPEPPESLVDEFENAWGSMEVLGKVDTDRLLAAELIAGSGMSQDDLYAPLTSTAERLTSLGCGEPLSTAVLLELRTKPGTPAALVEAWRIARTQSASDIEAALVAESPDPTGAMRRRDAWIPLLAGSDTDRRRAATYLATTPNAPSEAYAARARTVAKGLGAEFPHPALAAAIATSLLPFEPAEVNDWVAKGVEAATASQLAPRRVELDVLGLALVRDLLSPAPPADAAATEAAAVARVALHAWIFRDTVRGLGSRA